MFKKLNNLSITYKLSGIITLLIMTAMLFVGIFSYTTIKKAIISRTFEQLTSVRFEKTRRINNFLNTKILELHQLANTSKAIGIFDNLIFNDSTNQNSIDLIDFNHIIGDYLLKQANVNKFLIYNNKVLYYVNPEETSKHFVNFEIAELDEIINDYSTDSAAIISDLLTNDKGEIVFYIFAKLICKENNTYIGFEIPSKSINDIMLENNPYNGLGNSGEVYLAGEDRLMRSQSRFVENSVLKIQVPNSIPNNIDQNNFVAETTLDYRGIKVLSSSGIIEWGNTKWTIFAEIDYKEALIPVNTLRDSIIFIGLLGIILFTSIVMILIITITKPVAKLKKAADEISGGNYNVNVPVNNTDEIGQLSDTFNQMVQKIDEQKKRLDYEKLNRVQEMIDWQETERQRLSRELHDGIGQLLLSVKMRLGRIKGKTENDERIINDSQNIIQQTVNDVRNISNNLMPSVLSEFGLKQAVENILKDISQNYKIATSCDINLTSLDDNKTITYLYRIIQEAVSNTLKYAKSKSINITITEEENLIKLEIKDDGIGFNPNQVIGSGSNGLRNIRERVKLLNGKCSIKSSQGNGTVIYIEIIK